MITSRPLQGDDIPMLQQAMDDSVFHPGQNAKSYAGKNMFATVYEDEQGPIGVLKYTKTLRLRTIWCDEKDRIRNGASIVQAIEDSVKMARESGFTEVIFQTDNLALARFCVDRLGFEESRGEYRKEV